MSEIIDKEKSIEYNILAWVAKADLIGAEKLIFDGEAVIRVLRSFLDEDRNYDVVIEAIKKQTPMEPICFPDANWVYEVRVCPTCGRSVGMRDHHCVCGQSLKQKEE